MTFSEDVSIAPWQEHIASSFRSVGKMHQIHPEMYDIPSSRSTTRLSTKQNQGHVCRSPIHTYRERRPSTGAAGSVAILNVNTLILLT